MNLEKAKTILEELFREVSGCRFIVLIDTKELKSVLEFWGDSVENQDELRDKLIHILKYIVLDRQKNARNPFIRSALQDFRSLTFEMERGYALFTATPFENYVIASGIRRDVGLGFWRASLTRAMEKIKDAADKG